MAIKTNLIVDQGTNFVYNVYLIDSAGDPFPLTDYSANAQIRRSYTSYSYATMNVDINEAGGVLTLSMNSTTTGSLTNTRYVYDLELTSNTGIVSRIVEGYVSINLGVTR
jgi:FlaG/FlaF family flagellin (archaellin)